MFILPTHAFMKFLFGLLLALSIFSVGCEPKPADEDTATSSVDLASDGVLEASFMSDHKTFAYTFEYDGDLIQMVEGEGAVVGPQFVAEGGATISGRTTWVSDVVLATERAGAPMRVGAYQVYRYMDSEGTCALSEAVIPYGQEALLMTLKICEGQDGDKGREAMDALLEGLLIQAQ